MAMEFKRAYGALNMPASRYLLQFAVPIIATGVLVVVILKYSLPYIFDGPLGTLFWLIPLFFAIVALLYPYLIAESRRSEINHNIHFFITHMGVLATSNIPRSEIMRMLSEKKEYGALAEETRKIYALTDSWNMALPEACRFIAKRTPSEIHADFLDRFAYSLESGEDLEGFLKNEQKVVLNDYAAIYKGHLYEVENMKNLFNSMMMSVVFIVIFAVLMPVITGISASTLILGALAMVAFIEVVFIYFTKAKAPTDPMWHSLKIETPVDKIVKKWLPISLVLAFFVTVLALNFSNFPFAIILAVGLTPLLITGLPVSAEEEKVKRRDDNFAAFIRSLGASASARGGQITEVLRHLQNHDFGPLTANVKDLYSRLNLRVDDEKAWRYFAGECGSNLIEKFSSMFIEGVKAGGKPDAIGRIISDNFVDIVTLRKSRYQTASSFRGMLYGLVAGMAFALFVGVGIVGMMQGIFDGIELSDDTPFVDFLHFEANIPFIGFVVVLILLAHSMASSMMVKVADGGNYFRTYVDFVGMFWVAAIVSVGAQSALERLL